MRIPDRRGKRGVQSQPAGLRKSILSDTPGEWPSCVYSHLPMGILRVQDDEQTKRNNNNYFFFVNKLFYFIFDETFSYKKYYTTFASDLLRTPRSNN